MNKNLIATIIILITIALSCRKDKVVCSDCLQTANNCENIENIKNFFSHKIGSWWVYREEYSGKLDTLVVTNHSENNSNYLFDVRLYSTEQMYYYHYWPIFATGNANCTEDGIICSGCLTVKLSKYKPGNFLDEIRCFYFIPDLTHSGYESNSLYPYNKNSTEQILDTFSNQYLHFQRTIVMFEDHSLLENYQPTRRYYSEDVGLIRKELLDSNEVWNLIDYYIQE